MKTKIVIAVVILVVAFLGYWYANSVPLNTVDISGAIATSTEVVK